MAGIARHTPTLTGDKAVRLVVADTALLPDISDALFNLVNDYEWLEVGDSVADIVNSCWGMLEDYYSMLLVGQVATFLITPPAGWLAMDGSTHAEVDYPELFALLPAHMITGSNFTLPDMTGSFLATDFTPANLGTGAGSNSYALTTAQLPVHTHNYIPPVPAATVGGAGPPLPSTAAGAPIATTPTGSGANIDNRPEFLLFSVAVYAGRE